MGSIGEILKTTTTTTRLKNLYEALAGDERSASDPMLGSGQGEGSQEKKGTVKRRGVCRWVRRVMYKYILASWEDFWGSGAIYPNLEWAYRWVGWAGYLDGTAWSESGVI